MNVDTRESRREYRDVAKERMGETIEERRQKEERNEERDREEEERRRTGSGGTLG